MSDPIRNRNACLDGLRSFAIIFVLVTHSMGMVRLPSFFDFGFFQIPNFFYNGWMGVELFFVLSGYLLSFQILGTSFSFQGYKNFIAKRFFRIAPPYYVSVLLVLFMLHYLPQWQNVSFFDFLGVWFWQVLAHFIFLHDYIGREPVIDGVFWSIPIEMKFYLILPLFVWLILKIKNVNMQILSVFLLIILYLFCRNFWVLSSYGTEAMPVVQYFKEIRTPFHLALHGLLVGVLCGFIHYRVTFNHVSVQEKLCKGLVLLGTLLFALTVYTPYFTGGQVEFYERTLISPLFCLSFGFILLGFVLGDGFQRFFQRKFWKFIAQISYALYLTQMVPLYCQLIVFNHFNQSLQNIYLSWILSLPIFIISAVIVAYFLHRFVEKPCIQWSKVRWGNKVS